MNKKKTIIAAIVLLLLLCMGGAMAYFTDKEEKENVFTIGKVDITLTEPVWDAATDTNNNHIPDYAEKMVPGQEIDKDPKVTLSADSNDAYVFVKVEVPCVGTKELFTYVNPTTNGWTAVDNGSCEAGKAVKVYGFNNALTAGGSATLFSKVTLVDSLTSTERESITVDPNMPITAYAIQKDEVDGTLSEIWSTHFGNN